MKIYINILIVVFSLGQSTLLAQGFHKYSKNISYKGDISYSLASATERPRKVGKLDIDVDELKNIDLHKIDKLVNLEILEIKITEDPEAEDEIKLQRIKSAVKLVDKLKAFEKAPKLRLIILGIGERLFILQKDLKHSTPNKYNLDLAYVNLGQKTQIMLPKIKITAYNWAW